MARSVRVLWFAAVVAFVLGPLIPPWPSALAVIGPCMPSLSPPPGSPIPVGDQPSSAAVGNFNGDAFADLAITVLPIPGAVAILLGRRDGWFSVAPGSPVGVGSFPLDVTVGRFNGDGFDDLAVVNSGGSSVTILLGNGNGTFNSAPGSPIAIATSPEQVTVGEFNGDGVADLAIGHGLSNRLTILLGVGTGAFNEAAGSPIPLGGFPSEVVVDDFDRDGRADVAVSLYNLTNSVAILLGRGDGTFAPAPGSPVAVGERPLGLAVGRFNGDGIADLAVGNATSADITILLGRGDGTFAAAPGSPIPLGTSPRAVAVGRFNGDGLVDLVVANVGADSVTTLLGNGDGTFVPSPGGATPVGDGPVALAVASFRADGIDDLAVVNVFSDDVTILLGACPLADLGVAIDDAPDPVAPGATLTYSMTARNLGPNPAVGVSLTDALPAGTTFESLAAPTSWSCTTPAVGATGTVTCTIGALPAGAAAFTLVVRVAAGLPTPSALSNVVTIAAATADAAGANNSATATTTVGTGLAPAPTPTPTPPAQSVNSGDKKDERPRETEDQRRQRERTNQGNRDSVSIEGDVLAVEEAPALASLLVTIGVTRNEKLIVQVPCGTEPGGFACPDIRVGDYLEADGYQNGVGDDNDYFVAVDAIEVRRHGKEVR